MKTLTLQISGMIIGALIVAAFTLSYMAQANGPFITSAITANQSLIVEVGPDTDVQVLASTSRSYAMLSRDGQGSPVYCNADGDAVASTTLDQASFKLSTSTGETYEFHIEKNPYDGAVRCTATASTSVIVFELKRN